MAGFDILGVGGNSATGSGIGQTVSNGFGSFSVAMYYLFIGLIVLAIVFALLYIMSFKHKVVLYKATNSGTVVLFTKAREFKTKEGVPKWRLLNTKLIKNSYPAPTNDYVQIAENGKFVAHGNFTTTGTLNWRKMSDNPETPDSFTSEEKLMSYVEMRRAMEYDKQKLSEKLMLLAPALVVLMILVVFMIFFGDVVEPFKEASGQIQALNVKVMESQEQLTVTSERLALASERIAQVYNGYPVTPPDPKNFVNVTSGLKAGQQIPN